MYAKLTPVKCLVGLFLIVVIRFSFCQSWVLPYIVSCLTMSRYFSHVAVSPHGIGVLFELKDSKQYCS